MGRLIGVFEPLHKANICRQENIRDLDSRDSRLVYHPTMVLDDLHELIETLQARLDAHASELQKNEALTRYALIDPLLRGLGWDTSDPSQVLVEFRSQSGAADYALLGAGGRPLVIVEAKKLGTQLQAAVGQVINYCIHDGFEYFAVTDGQHWELYETNRPGPLSDRLAMQLNLKDEPADTCLRSLALWRPSTMSGQIRSGSIPIVDVGPSANEEPYLLEAIPGSEPPPVGQPDQIRPRQPRPAIMSGRPPSLPTENGQRWMPLSRFDPGTGNKPSAIRFPTGDSMTVSTWKAMAVTIAQWLCRQGHLNQHHLPINNDGGRRTLVASSQRAPDGEQHFVKAERLNASFSIFMEINMSAKDLVESSNTIISHVGMDPAEFAVKLRQSQGSA